VSFYGAPPKGSDCGSYTLPQEFIRGMGYAPAVTHDGQSYTDALMGYDTARKVWRPIGQIDFGGSNPVDYTSFDGEPCWEATACPS
jgi:hypothetical protein